MLLDLLARLFYFLSGPLDPEEAKKRRLKHIGRELARSRYARFYKPKLEEAAGDLGQFFFDIYREIAPAQLFLRNAARSVLLKQIVAESFLDNGLEDVRERLTESAIAELAAAAGISEMVRSVNKDIAVLSAAFDRRRIKAIDRCYCNILSMIQFISFDFYSLVKKFDSGIMERDFFYHPDFSNISGAYISDEIKNFLEISFALDPNLDWKKILLLLKAYRNGTEVISPEQWYKIVNLIEDLRRSGFLEMMVWHIEKDPLWQFQPKFCFGRIAENYLEAKKAEIRTIVDKIIAERKKARRQELVYAVFGREIQRTQYYTEKAGEMYIRKNFDGFLYAGAINYLLAFLLNIKPEWRELCDLLSIRGKWIAPDRKSVV
jgi:hypothetical protein